MKTTILRKNNYTEITIKSDTDSENEINSIGESIHNQLVGNSDYIENRIILNVNDAEKGAVKLLIYDDTTEVTSIELKEENSNE